MTSLEEFIEHFRSGQVVLVDKPYEKSSFWVVNQVRREICRALGLKKLKVGHAGTLDPLATGLLILCVGKETKNITQYQGQEKEYTGTIRLGASTPSYDLETEVDQTYPIDHITEELIRSTIDQHFTGEILQAAPQFSALKINGKRSYEYAREGKDVEIRRRLVEIPEFEITQLDLPDIHFRIRCSKGTYIRSIAHDLGQALNSGGHLTALRRTAIGEYSVDGAQSVEDFKSYIKSLDIPSI